jgi:putative transposase
MPRRAHLSLAGMPWHIIERGNNRAVCFQAEGDYRPYLDELADQSKRLDCTVNAYVLMTNPGHRLLNRQGKDSAGQLMMRHGLRHVQYINRT